MRQAPGPIVLRPPARTHDAAVVAATEKLQSESHRIATLLYQQQDGEGGAEGNAGMTSLVFTVTLNAPSALPVTLDYRTLDGTAGAGKDYAAKTGTISFAAGTTSQTITIPVYTNTLAQLNRAFSVELMNPVGATLTQATAQAESTPAT